MKLYIYILLIFLSLTQSMANDEITTVSIYQDEDESSEPMRIVSIRKMHIYVKELNLSEIKDKVEFKIYNAFDLPNSLEITRKNMNLNMNSKMKENIILNPKILFNRFVFSKISRRIKFKIDKDELQVGDNIIIRTHSGKTIAYINVVK